MDFLDQSVLPQSLHHMVLLRYLLALSYLLFLPYVSVLFGSLACSLFYKRRWEKRGEQADKIFSKQIIDQVTYNKGIAFALGVVPLLSSAFGYAQLLHLSGLNVPEFLFLSLFILIAALLLIYIYKYTFHLKDIFNYAEVKSESDSALPGLSDDIASYTAKTGILHKRSGQYGLILLLISVYLFYGSVELASDAERWTSGNNILGAIFSLPALIGFIQFTIGSVSVTSVLILYLYFRKGSDLKPPDERYGAYIRSVALQSGLISSVILAVVFVVSVLMKPIGALSFEFFIVSGVILLLLLVVSILFYAMLKEGDVKYGFVLIYVMLFIFISVVIKEQFAFNTSSKYQSALLINEYDAYQKKLQEESGTAAPISGADIYNGRCIACHSFERKIVGPPYNQTMPKYEGKKELLVKFIMNPVKINPDYPAMPNQGLKPNEADAVADYLLKTYKK